MAEYEDEFMIDPPKRAPRPAPQPPQPAEPFRDMDQSWLRECTPEARVARTNVPDDLAEYGDFAMHPNRPLAEAVRGWTDDVLRGEGPTGLILLSEDPGPGKSTLAGCAIAALARAGYGDRFRWNEVCLLPVGASYNTDIEGDESELQPSQRPTTPYPAPCWYAYWPDLLEHHRNERINEAQWTQKLGLTQALVLDELEMGNLTQAREMFLLSHLTWQRHRAGRALIITTNLQPIEWLAKFGKRCADRMQQAEWFRIIRMTDPSLRRRRG